jgi:hypothetical protein
MLAYNNENHCSKIWGTLKLVKINKKNRSEHIVNKAKK